MQARGRIVAFVAAGLAAAVTLVWLPGYAHAGRRRCCYWVETCCNPCTVPQPCCSPNSTGATQRTSHYGTYDTDASRTMEGSQTPTPEFDRSMSPIPSTARRPDDGMQRTSRDYDTDDADAGETMEGDRTPTPEFDRSTSPIPSATRRHESPVPQSSQSRPEMRDGHPALPSNPAPQSLSPRSHSTPESERPVETPRSAPSPTTTPSSPAHPVDKPTP